MLLSISRTLPARIGLRSARGLLLKIVTAWRNTEKECLKRLRISVRVSISSASAAATSRLKITLPSALISEAYPISLSAFFISSDMDFRVRLTVFLTDESSSVCSVFFSFLTEEEILRTVRFPNRFVRDDTPYTTGATVSDKLLWFFRIRVRTE